MTALMYAVMDQKNYTESVKILLRAGADPEIQKNGKTALDLLKESTDPNITTLCLLDKKIQVLISFCSARMLPELRDKQSKSVLKGFPLELVQILGIML